jgi:acetyl-CoA carboxylase beta subunit
MSWLQKFLPSQIRTEGGTKKTVPEGLWAKCPGCNGVLYRAELERNLDVCPKCGHHMRIGARRRLEAFLDAEPRVEIGAEVQPVDALKFKDSKKYKDRLSQAQKATDETDALIAIMGQVKGVPPWRRPSSSGSWAVPWARWSASVSCVRPMPAWSTASRWSVSPPAAARACRRRCSP